jgi:hypothetical protein
MCISREAVKMSLSGLVDGYLKVLTIQQLDLSYEEKVGEKPFRYEVS